MTSLVPIVSSDIYKTYFDSPDVGVILKVMDFRQTSSDSSSYTLVPKLYPELKHNLENLSVVLRMKPVIDNGRVLFLDALVGNILQSNDYSNRQMISFFLHGLVELDMANSQTMEQIDKNWCKEMSITSRLYPLCPSIEDYLESLLHKISRGTTTMHVSDISHAHLFNFIAGNHDLFYIASVMRNPFVRGLGEYMWPLFRALTLIVPCNSIGLDFLLFSGIRQLALNCHPISYAISPKGRSVTCGSIVMIGASEGDRQTVITLDEPLVFENVVRIRVISLTLLVDHGASLSSLVRFKGGDRFQGMLELNNVFLRGGGIVISDLTRCFLDRCRVYDAVFGVRVSNVVDALFLNTSELPVGGWNFHNCLHAYACHDLGGMRLRFQSANFIGRYLTCSKIGSCDITNITLTDGGSLGSIQCATHALIQGYDLHARDPFLDCFPVHESTGQKDRRSDYPSDGIPDPLDLTGEDVDVPRLTSNIGMDDVIGDLGDYDLSSLD